MKKTILLICVFLFSVCSCYGVTSDALLAKVKKLETPFVDVSLSVKVTGDKTVIDDLGDRYEEVLNMKNSTIKYKKHNKIRVQGKLQGINVMVIQNGYMRKMSGGIYNVKGDKKNDPGQRQNSLDLGILSSSIWADNKVTVVSESGGVVKLKVDPIYGGNDKRHDNIWVDADTLKLVKRERYNGAGELRNLFEYKEYRELTPGYFMATKYMGYNGKKKYLGTTTYSNIKVNQKLADSLFKI
ncbi:MAG: outer membrane lipoprotein-sorting protein [Abditibacteriota bacterium]|nr:outer membrane lipoprotein-sorting protein [Abditibacteriota bacterium]